MKGDRIRKNVEFRTVYRRGKSFSNELLVLYVYKNYKNLNEDKVPINRVGISVSKKVGISVVRSRVKRLINESFRLNSKGLKRGYDLVFIARVALKDRSYKEVEASMLNLFKKAGLNNNEKSPNNLN